MLTSNDDCGAGKQTSCGERVVRASGPLGERTSRGADGEPFIYSLTVVRVRADLAGCISFRTLRIDLDLTNVNIPISLSVGVGGVVEQGQLDNRVARVSIDRHAILMFLGRSY